MQNICFFRTGLWSRCSQTMRRLDVKGWLSYYCPRCTVDVAYGKGPLVLLCSRCEQLRHFSKMHVCTSRAKAVGICAPCFAEGQAAQSTDSSTTPTQILPEKY